MSIKIALLKSNEEVICDMKEVITDENKLAFYSFKHPYVVKIESRNYDDEDEDTRRYSISYTPWIILTEDREFLINPDWVVTVYNPDPDIELSYTEKINGRFGNDGHGGAVGGGETDSNQTDPS